MRHSRIDWGLVTIWCLYILLVFLYVMVSIAFVKLAGMIGLLFLFWIACGLASIPVMWWKSGMTWPPPLHLGLGPILLILVLLFMKWE